MNTMGKTGRAFFVKQPRTIRDLTAIHATDEERAFEVVRTITLSHIAYENFITDMTVDRQFLEEYASRCSEGDVWKCLLVKASKALDGVLVIPLNRSWVKWASYLPVNGT